MKKNILIILLLFSFVLLFTSKVNKLQANEVYIANPWVECKQDFNCANKVSNTTFPLKLNNFQIRAMKDMIEIDYFTEDNRKIVIRKSLNAHNGDISGVYTKYPINKETKLKNGVPIKIRATKDKIFVMNMVAESGYYSAYCSSGMTKDEIEKIYQILAEAESAKPTLEELDNKYTKCELGDLVGKDVKRIKYHYYNIDYHKKDYSKKQILKLADECLIDGVASQREMDCCMSIKMFPEMDF